MTNDNYFTDQVNKSRNRIHDSKNPGSKNTVPSPAPRLQNPQPLIREVAMAPKFHEPSILAVLQALESVKMKLGMARGGSSQAYKQGMEDLVKEVRVVVAQLK